MESTKQVTPVYSDGSVEDWILNCLREKREGWRELLASQPGAGFHNFTDARENLMSWYPFRPESSVLEVGAGMGSLTGLLCDRCSHVTALEMSPRRTEILRLWHEDRKNLRAVCGDFSALESEEKFDYITIIGVLEYAGVAGGDGDPWGDFIRKAASLLAPGGVMLLAIENRFGLKYWCGAAEDHTGVPFDGIGGYEMSGKTGRFQGGKVQTFSKFQLEQMLENAGFCSRRFYYPLPDYKFPTLVVGEGYPLAPLDVKPVKYSYPEESELVADERRLLPDVIENGVFPFFANSFLIECSAGSLPENPVQFATMKRDYAANYRILTTIHLQGEVAKKAIHPEALSHLKMAADYLDELARRGISVIPHHWNGETLTSPKIELKRADDVFVKALMSGNIVKAKEMLTTLKRAIEKSSGESTANQNSIKNAFPEDAASLDFGRVLKRGYIDLTFENSFYSNGELIFFDQEWCLDDIPLSFILYRAIRYGIQYADFLNVKNELYRFVGISDEIKSLYERYESKMFEVMMDKQKMNIFDPQMYGEHLQWNPENRKAVNKMAVQLNNQQGHIQQLLQSERELKAKEEELANIKNSRIWHMASRLSKLAQRLHLQRK